MGTPVVHFEIMGGEGAELETFYRELPLAVMNSSGKVVMESILETKAATILQFIQGLRGNLQITFEEGTGPPGCTTCSSLTSRKSWCAIPEGMPC